MKIDLQNEPNSEGGGGGKGSFVLSFRFALAILCFFLTLNLYAQRVGMSVAIVCMVNHTAVRLMRDAQPYSSSNGVNLTMVAPSGELKNDSIDAVQQSESPCAANSIANSNSSGSMDGPFAWPKEIQGHILGAFFYGYLISQIPGGLMAERLGAKWVLFGFLSLSTLATMLTPVFARLGYQALIFARILAGVGSGAMYPGISALWGKWAPPMERSTLALVSYTGGMMGIVVAMPVSGILCSRGFGEGWSSIFYTYGITSVVILTVWAVIASSNPDSNRFISNKEKAFIHNSLKAESSTQSVPLKEMPWLRFATSGPVWAIIVANFCVDWGGYTLLTNIPTFYKEVLLFDIESNGAYSALPFLGVWIGSVVSPVIADNLRARNLLSTTATRKFFTAFGMLSGAAFMVGVSFLNCTQTGLAVTVLTLAASMNGVGLCGFFVNHIDIAPSYAGTLMGVSNGIAAASGFIAPIVAAVVTVDQTRESWQIVFFIAAAIFVFGGVFYIIFGSGVIQPWAREQLSTINEISLLSNDDKAPAAIYKPPRDRPTIELVVAEPE